VDSPEPGISSIPLNSPEPYPDILFYFFILNLMTELDEKKVILDGIIDIVCEQVSNANTCNADTCSRKKRRRKFSCEGCSDEAVRIYGYGGHPSQRRHMGLGGCMSYDLESTDEESS
jgi:hypothetical protein